MFRRGIFLIALIVTGCDRAAPSTEKAEPPLVAVSKPLVSPVTDTAEYTGRTEAVEAVEVRARVSGYLVKMNEVFTVGRPDKGNNVTQEVKAGTVLFEIDDRPYQAALEKAKADVLLAEARFRQADADVKRNEPLVKTGATTKADFDKLVADRDVASAQIASFKATIDAQQLNVDFSKVKAPVDGRVSRAYVTVGNLVAADQTLLTTIVSQDPMYVYFDIDARTMLLIQERIRAGKFKSARQDRDVVVRIGLENEAGRFPHEATVDLVDNRVDPGTSTLRVRAVLNNPIVTKEERLFTPGLFVRVQVPLGQPTDSLLVSERALGTDQGQKFLMVVNKIDGKNVAEYRPVAIGPMQKGGLRVVSPLKLIRSKDGLRLAREDEMSKAENSISAGDWVIVNGLQRVRPGMEVRTNEVPMPTQLPLLEAKEVKPADSK